MLDNEASTVSPTMEKLSQLRGHLVNISDKLSMVSHLPNTLTGPLGKLVSTDVPLHKELDELIDIAIGIENSIAL
jgi:hypothetical protein